MAVGDDPRRAEVRQAVGSHRVGSAREERSRRVILAELAGLERPFDPAASPTHVTASAIVVGPRGVVLHRHRRLQRWLQPGGHLEEDELPAEAAVRETMEETGLVVIHPAGGPRLCHLDVHRAARGHVHLDLRYLLWAADAPFAPGPGESEQVAWFSWPAALDVADDALTGGLEAARTLVEDPGVAHTGQAVSRIEGAGPGGRIHRDG